MHRAPKVGLQPGEEGRRKDASDTPAVDRKDLKPATSDQLWAFLLICIFVTYTLHRNNCTRHGTFRLMQTCETYIDPGGDSAPAGCANSNQVRTRGGSSLECSATKASRSLVSMRVTGRDGEFV